MLPRAPTRPSSSHPTSQPLVAIGYSSINRSSRQAVAHWSFAPKILLVLPSLWTAPEPRRRSTPTPVRILLSLWLFRQLARVLLPRSSSSFLCFGQITHSISFSSCSGCWQLQRRRRRRRWRTAREARWPGRGSG